LIAADTNNPGDEKLTRWRFSDSDPRALGGFNHIPVAANVYGFGSLAYPYWYIYMSDNYGGIFWSDAYIVYDGSDILLKDATTSEKTLAELSTGAGTGWFGDSTRMKIFPHDFVPLDDPDKWCVKENGAYLDDAADLVDAFSAALPIPQYYKPTHVRIYGSLTAAVNIYICDILTATSGSPLGSGTTDAAIELSDTGFNSIIYLSVVVSNLEAADRIYGGYVTILYSP